MPPRRRSVAKSQLAAADWSAHAIAKEFNRLKIPTKSGKVGGWQTGNIANVLESHYSQPQVTEAAAAA